MPPSSRTIATEIAYLVLSPGTRLTAEVSGHHLTLTLTLTISPIEASTIPMKASMKTSLEVTSMEAFMKAFVEDTSMEAFVDDFVGAPVEVTSVEAFISSIYSMEAIDITHGSQ